MAERHAADQMWAGGIKEPAACACGALPDRGNRWAHWCERHGGVCGDCWWSGEKPGCPRAP